MFSIRPLNLKDGLEDKTAEDFIYGISSFLPPSAECSIEVAQKDTDARIPGDASRMSPSRPSNEIKTHSQNYSPDEFLEIPSSAGLPPGIDWRQEGVFHGQESYSSFGQERTTASVNAYGNILQISKFLGDGTSGLWEHFGRTTSGILCAGAYIPEPRRYFSKPMEDLLDLSKDPKGGFGLCLNPELITSKPQLKFLHARWPRFTHKLGDLSVSIQYFANRGTVIQQYLFERTKKSDTHTPGGAVNDASQNPREDDDAGNQKEASQVPENQMYDAQEQTQHPAGDCPPEDQGGQKQTQEGLFPRNETKLDETFGITQKSSLTDCLRLNSRLQIYESESADPFHRYSHFNSGRPSCPKYDTSTGQNQYSLVVRNREYFGIEAVGLIIAVFVNGHPTKIAKTQDNSNGTYDIDLNSEDVEKFELCQKSKLEVTVAYKLRLMTSGCSWESTLIPLSELNLSDCMAQNSYDPNLSFSTSEHFDYIIKRNLEHILSVCSVPVSTTPIQDNDRNEGDVIEESTGESQASCEGPRGGSTISLTCGDISGHHALVSASL